MVAEFYPTFTTHEKAKSLALLRGVPALVMTGDKDLLTPAEHSAAIAERLPGSELVVVPNAGHLVLLEYPELVNDRFAALLTRAAERSGAPLPPTLRRPAADPGQVADPGPGGG